MFVGALFAQTVNADYGRYGYDRGYDYSYRNGRGNDYVFRNNRDPYYDKIDRRQHRRIQKGLRHGQLTRKEARVLRRKQDKIARLERRFKRDGWLSRKEQKILNKHLNKNHRLIRRFKQNDRVYNNYRPRGYSVPARAGYGYSRPYRGNNFALRIGANHSGLYLNW